MAAIALWMYSLLVWCGQPLLRRKLRRRARVERGYAQAVEERFGRYPPPMDSLLLDAASSSGGGFVWVHAVSLGETRAAAVLLAELRAMWPSMRLLLTHGTATGRSEGEKLLLPGDVQVWQPWDTRGAVLRFLRQFHPVVGILMETEVWPNLVAGCKRQGIPLVLANARMSEKSLASALRLAWLSRAAYAGLSAVWAQTQQDADRLRRLGAPVPTVLGNLKFDAQPDAAQLAQGRAWHAAQTRPVLMLASSREGEEALWLENFKENSPPALIPERPEAINSGANLVVSASGVLPAQRGAQWLIVPRHPQRFDAVYQLLTGAGLRVARRSEWGAPPQNVDVLLGDTLGEMPLYYGLADVALLGGSFEPLGGQNLIEAAACGCPVVMGPHTFNFEQAAREACTSGAAERATDMAQALTMANALAANGSRREAMRDKAAAFASAHSGAARATVGALAHLLIARKGGAQAGVNGQGRQTQKE